MVEMIHEYVAMSSFTDPSVPIMACPSQMACATIASGICCVMPRFMRLISMICSGGVWVEEVVMVAKPVVTKCPAWKCPDMGMHPQGREMVWCG